MKPPLPSPALGLLATLLGLSALLGWALDIAALKQGLASSVAMNPATAVSLALLGLEAARMRALNAHAALTKAGQLAILVVVATGLGKLSDLIFGTSLAVDQWLFGAALNAQSHYPSRMAPNTAACLVLLGVALQLMRGGTDSRVRNAQLLALLALLTGLLALAGNLFSARELAGLANYIPMAFNTAIAVCFIAASILAASPQKGLLKFVRWQSFQTRVPLASMAIFVTGVWSLTLYSSLTLRDDLQRQLGEQQFSTVSLLAGELEQKMSNRLSALETIAAEITPAMLADATALQGLLEGRPIFISLFNGGVFFTRLDGVSIAAAPLEARRLGVDYAARDFMVAALKEGKWAVGRPVEGRVLKVPTFGMAVPIRNHEGKTIGALVGATNLAQPGYMELIFTKGYGRTGNIYLVDPRHRLVVTSTDKSRVMQTLPAAGQNPGLDRFVGGYDGFDLYVNAVGVEVLTSVKHLPLTGWYLAIAMPTEEVFAPIHKLNQRHLVGAVLLTLLAGAVTWWMMRRQLQPLFATMRTLTALTNTDRPMLPLPVAKQDEIGKLIGAFNGLLAILTQHTTALAESRARYERAVNGTNDGIWEWIPAIGEDYFSPRWKQLLGYEDHELPNVQATFFDRIHPEDKTRVQQAIQAHLDERRLFHVELRMCCKSGEYRWFSARGQAEWDELGQPQRMAGSIADITERKQALAAVNESNDRLAAVMENLTEGLIMADHQGLVIYWNPTALAMFGFASMDDCRRPLAEFAELFEFRPLNEDRVLPVEDWPMSRVLHGEVLHDWEVRLRRIDQGWEKILAYSGWLIHSANGKTLAFVSTTDVSTRKQAEVDRLESEKQRNSEQAADLEAQRQAALAALNMMEDAVAAQQQAQAMAVTMSEQLEELRRWQQATLNREGRILSVKKEVNDLLAERGQPPRYPSALDAGPQA